MSQWKEKLAAARTGTVPVEQLCFGAKFTKSLTVALHRRTAVISTMSLPTPSTNVTGMLPPEDLEKYDAPLIALTNACEGDLRKLFYAFFSFLHRRTDFYLVPDQDDLNNRRARMGFREGDAEKLLLAAFRQFPLRRIPRRSAPEQTSGPEENNESSTAAVNEALVPQTGSHGGTHPLNDTATNPKVKPSNQDFSGSKTDELAENIRYTEEGLQVPVGNGGYTKKYRWTQTLEECTVMFGVHEGCRGKDLVVTIKPDRVSVRTKNSPPGKSEVEVFLEGNLTEKVVPAESTWTLESNILILTLYKQTKTFWKAVIEGDEMIDTGLVDSRRHIDEYDQETQAQIRKIIFDQSQGRKGLPTPDNAVGKKPSIPPLPPGVEYIDQAAIDKISKSNSCG